jgi:hypothetical protein
MAQVKTLLTPLRQGEIPQTRAGTPERHSKSWAYQDEEGRYLLGNFTPLEIPPDPTDRFYIVEPGDLARPDLIAYKMYGSVGYYWAILWLNGVLDPFETLYVGMMLRIPTFRRLAEYGVRG